MVTTEVGRALSHARVAVNVGIMKNLLKLVYCETLKTPAGDISIVV